MGSGTHVRPKGGRCTPTSGSAMSPDWLASTTLLRGTTVATSLISTCEGTQLKLLQRAPAAPAS
jgi:hypothetical protein